MQEYFQFFIKDTKYDSYKKLASLIFFISGLLFLLKGTGMHLVFDKILLFGASFILFAYSTYTWLYKKRQERSYLLIYILMIIVWLLESPYWYISLVYVILLVMHYMMEKDFVVTIADKNIQVNGLLKYQHAWNDFNNIVIKDGLLTLDFKNNKILQVEIDREKSSAFEGRPFDDHTDQIKFNEFCSLHLKP